MGGESSGRHGEREGPSDPDAETTTTANPSEALFVALVVGASPAQVQVGTDLPSLDGEHVERGPGNADVGVVVNTPVAK